MNNNLGSFIGMMGSSNQSMGAFLILAIACVKIPCLNLSISPSMSVIKRLGARMGEERFHFFKGEYVGEAVHPPHSIHNSLQNFIITV